MQVWYFLFSLLLLIPLTNEIFAEEISVQVDGGKLLSFVNTNEFSSMIFEIDPYIANEDPVTIKLPKSIWYLADSECNSVSPLILVDGNEATFSEHFEKNKQIITIDVVGGSKEIELLSSGPMAQHTTNFMYGQFCFMQEQGIFLSPKKQSDLGFMFYDVQCKDTLVKIIKKFHNSPACVTSTTAEKLIEREWGHS